MGHRPINRIEDKAGAFLGSDVEWMGWGGVGFGIKQSGIGKASLGEGLIVVGWGLRWAFWGCRDRGDMEFAAEYTI